jgi:hypothetical protein
MVDTAHLEREVAVVAELRSWSTATSCAAETIEQRLGGVHYGALQSSGPVEGRLALKKAVPRRSAKYLGNEPLVPG